MIDMDPRGELHVPFSDPKAAATPWAQARGVLERAEVFLVEDAREDRQGLFRPSEIRQALRELMRVRSTSIVEFQDVEREIKLIGDWYSARLYELVTRRFRVDDWRQAVKEKLDGLEGIYAIASDRFTVSWERRARLIELVAWYILLLGWGVLLVLDFYARGGMK